MKRFTLFASLIITLILLTACPQKEGVINLRDLSTIDSVQVLHRLYSTNSPREEYFTKTIKNPTTIAKLLSSLRERGADNIGCGHSGIAMIYQDGMMMQRVFYHLDKPCPNFGRHELTNETRGVLIRVERFLLDSLQTGWRSPNPRRNTPQ